MRGSRLSRVRAVALVALFGVLACAAPAPSSKPPAAATPSAATAAASAGAQSAAQSAAPLAPPPAPIVVSLAFTTTNAGTTPMWLAQEAGLFREQGLETTL